MVQRAAFYCFGSSWVNCNAEPLVGRKYTDLFTPPSHVVKPAKIEPGVLLISRTIIQWTRNLPRFKFPTHDRDFEMTVRICSSPHQCLMYAVHRGHFFEYLKWWSFKNNISSLTDKGYSLDAYKTVLGLPKLWENFNFPILCLVFNEFNKIFHTG